MNISELNSKISIIKGLEFARHLSNQKKNSVIMGKTRQYDLSAFPICLSKDFENWPTVLVIHKSHNAPVLYPTMHHSSQKCAHFSCEWCIVGHGMGALWDLWDWTMLFNILRPSHTVETLYSTIYYSKYFVELNLDKSTQYVALWTHKRHPIPRPFGRAMECLLWVFQQKLIVL